MQVIIDTRVAEVDPNGATAATIANRVAADHGVPGSGFALKIDGVVVNGAVPSEHSTIELVEVVDPGDAVDADVHDAEGFDED